MKSRFVRISTAFVIALPLCLAAAAAAAEDLPEGITASVIAEYKSRVPGIEEVRLVRVLIQPGAMFDRVEIKNEEYCELKKGTLTHTNHTTGVTDVFTAGARWAPPKGDLHTVVNNGDLVADMWVYQLIEQSGTADKM